MRWVDTHVHLFSSHGDNADMPLVFAKKALNTADLYLEILGEQKPEGIVVVDFSKSKNSEHVVQSLDELKKKGVKAAGVIKADLGEPRTLQWMDRADVRGIRLYAKESVPNLSGDEWEKAFAKVKKNKQHILIFGSGENLIATIKQVPEDIVILADHLGLPDVFSTNGDPTFRDLLALAKKRGNLYFKGPGYRTSLDVEKVKPVVKAIVEAVGIDKLILGASDGPFAGPVLEPTPQYDGKKFGEVMDYNKVISFISELASSVANNGAEKDKILCDNARKLYGF